MTIRWNEPIEALDGLFNRYPCRVISRDYRCGAENLIVVQIDRAEHSSVAVYGEDGSLRVGDHRTRLRNVPVKRQGWMLKKKGAIAVSDNRIFLSEKEAKRAMSPDDDCLVHGEWEE